jgi:HAD superfamily hydrolase (TIGR01509 family)
MIEAVLLEFEGVIADTRAARRRALLGALGEAGVLLTEAEYVESCGSVPPRDAVRAAFQLRRIRADDTGVELAVVGAERRFSDWLGKGVTLVDGARALLEQLHGRVRLGIVSRAGRREIDFVLRLGGIDHLFEVVVADENAFPSKPAPAPYGVALERLGRRRAVRPQHVIALEDGPAGIRAAKAAGLRCAAVGPLPAHLALEADALLPSLVGHTLQSIERLVTRDGELTR